MGKTSRNWDQIEQIGKFLAGIAWGTAELAFWGARKEALLFIATVLGVTELLRLAQKTKEKEG